MSAGLTGNYRRIYNAVHRARYALLIPCTSAVTVCCLQAKLMSSVKSVAKEG